MHCTYTPSTLDEALAFADVIRYHPNVVPIHPGPRHWEIFTRLCRDAKAAGNLVPDAYLAALAIEHGCEWITTDRDFARFPICAGAIHCCHVRTAHSHSMEVVFDTAVTKSGMIA